MKNKIAVLTLYGCFNYGNRLQNYAVEQMVKEWGFEPRSVAYDDGRIRGRASGLLKAGARKLFSAFSNPYQARSRRYLNFAAFNQELLNVVRMGSFAKQMRQFAGIIVGSDQVWNPIELKDSGFYFADFPVGCVRCSLAASFGVDQIPNELKGRYVDGLKHFDLLSVREDAGKSIVKELCGREADVLLDPVFYLDKGQWRAIERKPKEPLGEAYFVCYFLGRPSRADWELIEQYEKKTGYQRVDLYEKGSAHYVSGPREFLYFADHAQMVFTDSFHAVSFSIIFERAFWAFHRKDHQEDMFSRLKTLLKKFGLEGRVASNSDKEWEQAVSYEGVRDVMTAEKKKTELFLRRYFEMIQQKNMQNCGNGL